MLTTSARSHEEISCRLVTMPRPDPSLPGLPSELKTTVCKHLTMASLYGLRRVCKVLASFVQEDNICRIKMGLVMPHEYGNPFTKNMVASILKTRLPRFPVPVPGANPLFFDPPTVDAAPDTTDWAGQYYWYNDAPLEDSARVESKYYHVDFLWDRCNPRHILDELAAAHEARSLPGRWESWQDIALGSAGIQAHIQVNFKWETHDSGEDICEWRSRECCAMFFNVRTVGDMVARLVRLLYGYHGYQMPYEMSNDAMLYDRLKDRLQALAKLRMDAAGVTSVRTLLPGHRDLLTYSRLLRSQPEESDLALEDRQSLARDFLGYTAQHDLSCNRNNPRCQVCVLRWKRRRQVYID